MMKTQAYAAHAADQALQPYSFERRELGPKDVAITIHYCGICHSDIHTARSEWRESIYPCVPGHEIVGVVAAVGADVKQYHVGDNVGVGCFVGSCRECHNCQRDLEQYCEHGFVGTYNGVLPSGEQTKGGYSGYIVVDEHFVLRLANGVDLAATAPLLCAGITTYSPMRYAGVKAGDKLAVLGLGGLGHMAVKIAASFGAEVTVISRSPDKQVDAEGLGAHKFLLSSDAATVAKHAGYFDHIIDTVSAQHDLNLPASLLKFEGNLILVGAADKPLAVMALPLILQRRKIIGSLVGGLAETQDMLDHCAKHNITADIELIQPDYINQAYERMLNSDVKYRFVMDCTSLQI